MGNAVSPARGLAVILASVLVCVLVYGVLDAVIAWLASARFPAPEQALTWTRIGHFVAAVLALTAGGQTLRLFWQPRA